MVGHLLLASPSVGFPALHWRSLLLGCLRLRRKVEKGVPMRDYCHPVVLQPGVTHDGVDCDGGRVEEAREISSTFSILLILIRYGQS
jgi:hypothetical protein